MKNWKIWILIVPRYCYPTFEKKLSDMSYKGWHLSEHRPFIYRFEKDRPCKKIYFMCLLPGSIRNDDGLFDFALRHPNFIKRYAVVRKKSKFNRKNINQNKNPIIFEVDESKLDIGFNELKRDRNKWGYLDLLRESIIFLIPLMIFFFLTQKQFIKITCIIIIMFLLLNLIVGFVFTLLNSGKTREKPRHRTGDGSRKTGDGSLC